MKNSLFLLVISMAATTAFADSWFNADFTGANPDPSTGGKWLTPTSETNTAPTFANSKVELEDVGVDKPVVFQATEKKSAEDNRLTVTSTMKFEPYDELPSVPGDAKAGVVALDGGNYWVIGYDNSALNWLDSGIVADFANSVTVAISVETNNAGAVIATYTFGASSTNVTLAAGATEYQDACFAGNGSVSALAGTYAEYVIAVSGWEAADACGDDDTAQTVWGAELPSQFANVNAKQLATWAWKSGIGNVSFNAAKTDGGILVKAFLLNCANTIAAIEENEPDFKFASIVPGSAPTENNIYNHANYNGEILIQGKCNLSDASWLDSGDANFKNCKFFRAILRLPVSH